IAALKLQEIGYSILSIRKITGKGIADLTVRTPEGKLAVAEVTFENLEKAARKAIGIKRDVEGAQQALAISVNLGHHKITMVDAEDVENPKTYDFGEQLDSYYDPDVIYTNELE